MADERIRIAVDGSGTVSALVSKPTRSLKWTFVYAPGASADLRDPFGAFAAERLAAHGIGVVRFQFPYAEAGRKAPDRPALLEATWRAVIEEVHRRMPRTRLCAGGRSMGGRIASQVVAAGDAGADALALFAYPLHPPGRPEQTRDAHLPKLWLPVLFVSGTNDAFGSPEELRAASKKVRGARLRLLEGADHGFNVRKSTGRTKDDVFAEAVEALATWIEAL